MNLPQLLHRFPGRSREKGKLSVVKKGSIIAASLLFLAMTAMPANNAEEIVFSTPGFVMALTGNSKGTTTPFGFWIWCAGAAAPGSNGGYQNAQACQGAMYFYALDTHVTHVVGEVSEGPSGIYTMTVVQGTAAQLFSGTLHPAYACTLTNDTPDPKGPGNGVTVNCTFIDPSLGGGSGKSDVTNAVVNVTGP
jgi:hypothetical protein